MIPCLGCSPKSWDPRLDTVESCGFAGGAAGTAIEFPARHRDGPQKPLSGAGRKLSDARRSGIRFAPGFRKIRDLEIHASRHNQIVVGDWVRRHRHLIADPDDQVVAFCSARDWKAAQCDARGQQHLAEVLM